MTNNTQAIWDAIEATRRSQRSGNQANDEKYECVVQHRSLLMCIQTLRRDDAWRPRFTGTQSTVQIVGQQRSVNRKGECRFSLVPST